MQLQFSAEDEAFRLEVREFVRTRLPADIRRKVELGLRLEHQDYVTWFNILEARGGWLTPGWPREYGGPGWNHVQRYLFDEETQLGNAPRIIASGVIGKRPSPSAIKSRLQKTARDLGPTGFDTRYGHGLVDFAAATAPVVSVPVPPAE